MRDITHIVIHCTATPAGREVTIKEIDTWHRQAGFAKIGYHYVIHLDGSVSKGRPEEEVGAHVSGHNATTIGISYVGGVDANDVNNVFRRASLTP
ncbi:N-acetylmuramoyl-L-alanine amidase [Bosea sp. MMO-172]|uniref:N-acetylmuramoyl-L-alanine amidase n=1 Tax=Bosea sp. MMO-172 TaxID=3127885 RepID=UPI0030194419